MNIPTMEQSPEAPAGERGRAPRTRRWPWIAAWGCYSIALGALYVKVPPNPDSAIFDYIGWQTLRGARLYVDVGEQNFPGQMWLQALSTALFGNHLWSFRLFDYLLGIAGAGALAAMLALAGARLAALLVVPIYQAMIVTEGVWMSGQRDLVAALLLAAGGLTFVVRRRGGGRWYVAAFAVCLVSAVLIRPTYAAYAPILLTSDLLISRLEHRRLGQRLADSAFAFSLCSLLLGLVTLAFWRTGGLAAWYELAVRFNLDVYVQKVSYPDVTRRLLGMVRSWHWYLGFSAWGAWRWWRDERDRSIALVTGSLVVTVLISAYAQRKGFGYHVAGLLPILAFFVAYLVATTVDRARAGVTPARVGALVVVCGIASLGTAKKLWTGRRPQLELYAGVRSERAVLSEYAAGPAGFSFADVQDAAEYVRRTTGPSETVLTWSRAVHVNFLSERRSPLRFATIGMLALARPPFSRAGAWAVELAGVLETRPPEVILIPAPGAGEEDEVWLQASPSAAVTVLRRSLMTNYALERSFGTMDLYRLRRP